MGSPPRFLAASLPEEDLLAAVAALGPVDISELREALGRRATPPTSQTLSNGLHRLAKAGKVVRLARSREEGVDRRVPLWAVAP